MQTQTVTTVQAHAWPYPTGAARLTDNALAVVAQNAAPAFVMSAAEEGAVRALQTAIAATREAMRNTIMGVIAIGRAIRALEDSCRAKSGGIDTKRFATLLQQSGIKLNANDRQQAKLLADQYEAAHAPLSDGTTDEERQEQAQARERWARACAELTISNPQRIADKLRGEEWRLVPPREQRERPAGAPRRPKPAENEQMQVEHEELRRQLAAMHERLAGLEERQTALDERERSLNAREAALEQKERTVDALAREAAAVMSNRVPVTGKAQGLLAKFEQGQGTLAKFARDRSTSNGTSGPGPDLESLRGSFQHWHQHNDIRKLYERLRHLPKDSKQRPAVQAELSKKLAENHSRMRFENMPGGEAEAAIWLEKIAYQQRVDDAAAAQGKQATPAELSANDGEYARRIVEARAKAAQKL